MECPVLLNPGTIIGDSYEIVGVLGSGNMGVVYKARQIGLDRPVAIKIIAQTVVNPSNSEHSIRIEREALALSKLAHKNIVAFYKFDYWQNQPYFVMEYVEGATLAESLASGEKLPSDRCKTLAISVLQALSCIHEQGMVHRDLKPSNIMVLTDSEDYSVKIIDFGLIRLLPEYGHDAQKLTQTGFAIGTIMYMSPEQCVANPCDARSDLYSVGAILYHCLTGQPPYVRHDSVALMYAHVNMPPPVIGESYSQKLSQRWQAIIDRAMAKDPRDRYQCAEDMLRDVETVDSAAPLHRAGSPTHNSQRRHFATRKTSVLLLMTLALLGVVAYSIVCNQDLIKTTKTVNASSDMGSPEPAQTAWAWRRSFRAGEKALTDGQYLQARVLLKQASSLVNGLPHNMPEYIQTMDLYASALYKTGSLTEALTLAQAQFPLCQKTKDYKRMLHSYLLIASINDDMGRFDQAIEAAEKGLALLNKHANAGTAHGLQFELAIANEGLGNRQQANRWHAAAIETCKHSSGYDAFITKILMAVNHFTQRNNFCSTQGRGGLLKTARSTIDSIDFTAANASSSYIKKAHRTRGYVMIALAEYFLSRNQTTEMIQAANAAHQEIVLAEDQRQPNDLEIVLELKFKAYRRIGDLESSRQLCIARLAALKSSGHEWTIAAIDSHSQLGGCLFAQKKPAAAQQEYEKALALLKANTYESYPYRDSYEGGLKIEIAKCLYIRHQMSAAGRFFAEAIPLLKANPKSVPADLIKYAQSMVAECAKQ
jgi:serine/threonine protein kinase